MIVSNLKSNFDELLSTTDEIWFAVALVKESTYDYIQESIKQNCKQHYLAGIDLPTPPNVLRKMQTKIQKGFFDAGIYQTDSNYHPKVYLFRNGNNYTAFVGSSNLTDGGLEDNVELNYQLNSQQECLSILNWFDKLSKDAFPITDENLKEYEEQFKSIEDFQIQIKRKKRLVKLRKQKVIETGSLLDTIDFSDRFFKREHHSAFRKELWKDSSIAANKERHEAQDRFLELHETIFSKFANYGIGALEPNVKNHIVSMSYHLKGATTQNLGAMWLSYGKSQQEIKKYKELFTKVRYDSDEDDKMSFINHSRLQIRIELESIGIWILFGKNNGGSEFDRKYFLDEMVSENYKNNFFKKISALPEEYWIKVDDKHHQCNMFDNASDLYEFCKKDNSRKYFIIGRDYDITDTEMSEDNLPKETLIVFQKLFPIYDMMRHKFS